MLVVGRTEILTTDNSQSVSKLLLVSNCFYFFLLVGNAMANEQETSISGACVGWNGLLVCSVFRFFSLILRCFSETLSNTTVILFRLKEGAFFCLCSGFSCFDELVGCSEVGLLAVVRFA